MTTFNITALTGDYIGPEVISGGADVTTVRRLTPADAPACDAIIAALPYFFRDL